MFAREVYILNLCSLDTYIFRISEFLLIRKRFLSSISFFYSFYFILLFVVFLVFILCSSTLLHLLDFIFQHYIDSTVDDDIFHFIILFVLGFAAPHCSHACFTLYVYKFITLIQFFQHFADMRGGVQVQIESVLNKIELAVFLFHTDFSFAISL